MTGRVITRLAVPTSMTVDTQNPYSLGNRLALGQISVSLTYTGADPLLVPTGATGTLLTYSVGLGANPPDFVTFGTTVPEVFIFASTQGTQHVFVTTSFNPIANEGNVIFSQSQEVGAPLDTGAPVILGSFTASAFSNNSFQVAKINDTFAAPTFLGLEVQTRLVHDKGTDITIENITGTIVTQTAATSEPQRN